MVFALFLFATPSAANQIHFEPMPLEDVVQGSDLIVVVSEARPPQQTIRVHVAEHPTLAPMEVGLHRVRVRKVIHDPENRVEPGAIIEVAGGSAPYDLSQHILLEVHGVMESPIYPRYASPFRARLPKRWVALLRSCDLGGEQRLCETVPGAMERVRARSRIEAALAMESGETIR